MSAITWWKKGKIGFLMYSCKCELLLFKKHRKEPVLFLNECQMILVLHLLPMVMMRIDSFLVEVSVCFHILGDCLEVTIFVWMIFDLLVITDLAKDSELASFGLGTREFNKCSLILRW